MKAISFSATEILQSLLDKKKTQTIRPMSKNKKPRLIFGEQATLYWRQRSKFKWFCKKCGEKVCVAYTPKAMCLDCREYFGLFNKKLGTVQMTEIFIITMQNKGDELWIHRITETGKEFVQMEEEHEIVKRDGFKNWVNFLSWFDIQYDLSEPKTFVVYRWVWLK
jgi:hypothetical protein